MLQLWASVCCSSIGMQIGFAQVQTNHLRAMPPTKRDPARLFVCAVAVFVLTVKRVTAASSPLFHCRFILAHSMSSPAAHHVSFCTRSDQTRLEQTRLVCRYCCSRKDQQGFTSRCSNQAFETLRDRESTGATEVLSK